MNKLSQWQKVAVGFVIFVLGVWFSFYLGASSSFKLPLIEPIWAIVKFLMPTLSVFILLVLGATMVMRNLSDDMLAQLIAKAGFGHKLKPAYQPGKVAPEVEQPPPTAQAAPEIEQTEQTEPDNNEGGRPRYHADEEARRRHHYQKMNFQQNYELWLKEALEETPNRQWQDARRSFNDILKRKPKNKPL